MYHNSYKIKQKQKIALLWEMAGEVLFILTYIFYETCNQQSEVELGVLIIMCLSFYWMIKGSILSMKGKSLKQNFKAANNSFQKANQDMKKTARQLVKSETGGLFLWVFFIALALLIATFIELVLPILLVFILVEWFNFPLSLGSILIYIITWDLVTNLHDYYNLVH